MSTIDLCICLVACLLTIFGAWRGFFSQLVGWASILLSFFLAPAVSNLLMEKISGPESMPEYIFVRVMWVFSGILIYFGVKVLGTFLQKNFVEKFTIIKMGNRAGGAVFGFAKSIFLVMIVALIASWVPSQAKDMGSEKSIFNYSHLLTYAQQANTWILKEYDGFEMLNKKEAPLKPEEVLKESLDQALKQTIKENNLD